MDIRYFHEQGLPGRFTASVVSPTKEELIGMVADKLTRDEVSTEIGLGLAKVHPTDQYNKFIGREVSTKRLQYEEFHLKTVEFIDGKIFYYFNRQFVQQNSIFITHVEIVFSTTPTSDYVKLQHVNIQRYESFTF